MIRYFPPESRYCSTFNGVTTRSLFSYDRYFDPGNIHFGPVLAFNDYEVSPGCGFGYHPHQEVEQIFFIYEGHLSHYDSLNTELSLEAPSFQRITTGSGYARSSMNSGNGVLRYLGIWFQPRFTGLAPGMEKRSMESERCTGTFFPLATGHPDRFPPQRGASPIVFNTDATVYLARLTAGQELQRPVWHGKRCLTYMVSGSADAGSAVIDCGGHIRVSGSESFAIKARDTALLVHIELG
ncbi:MAG: pirin family protein [Mailhella sp.]|nr:pirin family protein [Mailhella sp.]